MARSAVALSALRSTFSDSRLTVAVSCACCSRMNAIVLSISSLVIAVAFLIRMSELSSNFRLWRQPFGAARSVPGRLGELWQKVGGGQPGCLKPCGGRARNRITYGGARERLECAAWSSHPAE